MQDEAVFGFVRMALEVLSASELKVQRFSAASGSSGVEPDDLKCMADRTLRAVTLLPAEQHLAVMAWVFHDDYRRLPLYFADLVSFARHGLAEKGVELEAEWLVTMVRLWLKLDRSFRVAAEHLGVNHETVAAKYRATVEPLLDGWRVAGKGSIEPLYYEWEGKKLLLCA
ncbi:hypothetical protein OL229_04270 [Neisseriaceae bacterium JH1-16]|nr:hypothetical protein [Neisseriaceae bacterium JH1-16]